MCARRDIKTEIVRMNAVAVCKLPSSNTTKQIYPTDRQLSWIDLRKYGAEKEAHNENVVEKPFWFVNLAWKTRSVEKTWRKNQKLQQLSGVDWWNVFVFVATEFNWAEILRYLVFGSILGEERDSVGRDSTFEVGQGQGEANPKRTYFIQIYSNGLKGNLEVPDWNANELTLSIGREWLYTFFLFECGWGGIFRSIKRGFRSLPHKKGTRSIS